MNVKTLAAVASALSIAATLISFFDVYVLGSALSQQQNVPEQVSIRTYLVTVSILCVIMLALSNRKLEFPYKSYIEKATELQIKLDGYADIDVEVDALKKQVVMLQTAASEEKVLESRIRGVLLAGAETESGLIRKLLLDASDECAIGRVQSTLGRMEQEHSIEASFGRFQLVKKSYA